MGVVEVNLDALLQADKADREQKARSPGLLLGMQLVEFYLGKIHKLNPILRGVIEVNPDALFQADNADRERKAKLPGSLQGLHGIPILLKDNIATKDKMNTTAGSFALLKSVVPRDAGVVRKLRKAGAIILGKASLSEWAGFRFASPYGWCARTSQGQAYDFNGVQNPYVLSATPCGSIVGIKPTLGLTSRAGVVPISPRQDTVGPICRTVSDAVEVLDVIVGFDYRDEATRTASKYIPQGGYKQFLNANGLKGKRLGIVRNPFYMFGNGSVLPQPTLMFIYGSSGEYAALEAEFKISLNAYLKELVASPVRTLADVIAFNNKFSHLEKIKEYGQDIFLQAEATNGINKKTLLKLARLSRNGFEKLMKEHKLDALVTPGADVSSVLAIGGFPGITVPAGYDSEGVPFGICFGGLKGSEPKLIEIAYSFEQVTKIRKPPSFKP
ncbi:putative amidase C869.01 [Vitis vinifera]|uniref:Putative amidase C869.01 n=1 Tax=Vitis vinifera TaxID=29760 RepID=A0A438DT67_VITVI|nr:putative amidase C869.01 [Vitis vinifera]